MITIGRHVSKLSGYAPALPTPFEADDKVDCEAFARFCELQVGEGASALVVCTSTAVVETVRRILSAEADYLAWRFGRGMCWRRHAH